MVSQFLKIYLKFSTGLFSIAIIVWFLIDVWRKQTYLLIKIMWTLILLSFTFIDLKISIFITLFGIAYYHMIYIEEKWKERLTDD